VRNVPAIESIFTLSVVSTPTGCTRGNGAGNASDANWITHGPNENALQEVHVVANPNAAPRTGTATIAGETLTVIQDGSAGSPCTFRITPASASFSAAGGTGSVTVETLAGCPWSLNVSSLTEDWVKGDRPTRVGSATETYTVMENRTGSAGAGRVRERGLDG
jgi:hypothetical protein